MSFNIQGVCPSGLLFPYVHIYKHIFANVESYCDPVWKLALVDVIFIRLINIPRPQKRDFSGTPGSSIIVDLANPFFLGI